MSVAPAGQVRARTHANSATETAEASTAEASTAEASTTGASTTGASTAEISAAEISAAEITGAELRHAMGHFATGVTVITSVGPDGRPVGTTANAVSSLSLDPPLVLVCFDRASQTLAAVRAHGAFAVNVLSAPQRELSANFARRGLAAAWDGVRHRPGLTGSPKLHGVLSSLECTVEHELSGGDHEIVVGRVRTVETSDAEASPLLFWRGQYVALREPEASPREPLTDGTNP